MTSAELHRSSSQIEMPEALSCVSRAAEAIESRHALESMVAGAIATSSSRPRLGEDLAFAILSTKDRESYRLHAEEERIQAPRACDKKKTEFRLGRAAAHLALTSLGCEPPAPILRGRGGEPLWPCGVTGSITHCDPWSIALVAKSANRLAIGIDLESVQRVKVIDISSLVCRDVELKWVRSGRDFYARLAMVFSAKEALYKALYPFWGRYIDFKEVELSAFSKQGVFGAEFLTCFPQRLMPRTWLVHSRQHKGLVFSSVIAELK